MKKYFSSFGQDLSRAIKLLWRVDRLTTIFNMAIQGIQAILPVISLYYMKAMVEAITLGKAPFNTILPYIIIFGAVQFLSAIVSQCGTYVSAIYQEKLTDYLSTEVLLKAVDVDYEYYENPSYHDTMHLAQQQSISRITQLFTIFNSLILNSLSLVFLVSYLFSLHSLFALFFMLLSIPLAVIKWYSGSYQVKLERKFAPMERESTYLHYILTGITSAKEVRVFGFGHAFITRFRKIRKHILKERRKLNLRFTGYSLIAEGLEVLILAVVFGTLAKQTWEKSITIGSFIIYTQAFQRLQGTGKSFLQSWVQLFQQRLFLQNIFSFFDLKTKDHSLSTSSFPPVVHKGIAITDVSFTYPETTRPVLHNVSLNFEPGKVVAIVGENGSGKSTLVKLLARLYNVQTGSITVDGTHLTDVKLEDFRAKSIFLFQDFEKYFFNIEENIALGHDGVDDEKIRSSAVLSGADAFIQKLTHGYKTRMGRLFNDSEQLSGGQWQKLVLSRMFYKDAALVVLDEPSSALDANAEFELYKNVKEHLSDKMVVLITHRLHNLRIADHIYLLKDGSIIESGSLQELTDLNGEFLKMYNAQKI